MKKAKPYAVINLCQAAGCTRAIYTKGYCHTHGTRFEKWGDAYFVARRGANHPTGPDSWLWSETPGYTAVHSRLRRERGQASNYTCLCGKQARDWAITDLTSGILHCHRTGRPYTPDLWAYTPLCRSHHIRLDRGYITLEEIALERVS